MPYGTLSYGRRDAKPLADARMRGLHPRSKAARLASYVVALRKELLQLSRAIGVNHPGDVTLEHFNIIDDTLHRLAASDIFSPRSVFSERHP
jgi:hypothetical protein